MNLKEVKQQIFSYVEEFPWDDFPTKIDYSQYKDMLTCEALWYEKYVRKVQKRYKLEQRDDALALGSLVHNGLEHWYKDKTLTFSPRTLEETTPSKECLNAAKQLLQGYSKRFPQDPFEIVASELLVPFPIGVQGVCGVAKIDQIAYLSDNAVINMGDLGDCYTGDGLYAHEFKTKSASVNRAFWCSKWTVNMQASFQMMALRAISKDLFENDVLVSVLEKPNEKPPIRKCRKCETFSKFANWIFVEENKFKCPKCGNVQKLKPYKPKGEKEPNFFRFFVSRNSGMLDEHERKIQKVAVRMTYLKYYNRKPFFNDEACVDRMSRFQCEYFEPHAYNTPPEGDTEKFQIVENPFHYWYGE